MGRKSRSDSKNDEATLFTNNYTPSASPVSRRTSKVFDDKDVKTGSGRLLVPQLPRSMLPPIAASHSNDHVSFGSKSSSGILHLRQDIEGYYHESIRPDNFVESEEDPDAVPPPVPVVYVPLDKDGRDALLQRGYRGYDDIKTTRYVFGPPPRRTDPYRRQDYYYCDSSTIESIVSEDNMEHEKENKDTNKGKNTSQLDAAAAVTNADTVQKKKESLSSFSRDNAAAASASAMAFHQRRLALREALFESARRRTELRRTDNDKPLTNTKITTPVVTEEKIEDYQRPKSQPREEDVEEEPPRAVKWHVSR